MRHFSTLKKDYEELPEIGRKVRNARERKGLSLRVAANLIGISNQQLCAMELGQYRMNPKVIQFFEVNANE